MTKKRIEAIIAVVILIALIVLVAFLLLRKHPEDTTSNTPEVPATNDLPPLTPEQIPAPAAVSAQTVSRVFIERFGSYSTESDFQNVADVLELATPNFQTQLLNLVEAQRQSADDGYYGVSTFVISSKITAQTDTTMTILTTTQRRESVGSPDNTSTRYQDIEVKLEKINDNWLIAGYTWQD